MVFIFFIKKKYIYIVNIVQKITTLKELIWDLIHI